MIFWKVCYPNIFFHERCFPGGKQYIHKVSAAFIVKNCHPRTSLSVAGSNLVVRKSKCYFIIKFSLFLSIKLWREIRPDAGKTTENEFVARFSEMTSHRSRFGQNSCVDDEQVCVFGSCAFNKHSVLKIFIINGLNFQTV